MNYMTNYILKIFNTFETPNAIEIDTINSYKFSDKLEQKCKNWIYIHFTNNKLVNNLLKNLDDEQIEKLYDFCFSYIDKIIKNKTFTRLRL